MWKYLFVKSVYSIITYNLTMTMDSKFIVPLEDSAKPPQKINPYLF